MGCRGAGWISVFLLAAGVSAQTFPAEFRTEDARVVSLLESAFAEPGPLAGKYPRLIALPANRVYTQMDAEARAAALRVALPLLRQIVMSDALQKQHDGRIALQYGAVDHGLRLPPVPPDPRKRLEEMTRQMEKNPSVAANPKFMEEFMALQQAMGQQGLEDALDAKLNLFTRPLADVKAEVQREREALAHMEAVKKCYDSALAVADSAPDRFRLLAYGCPMLMYDVRKSEPELDRLRKERAQRLYDRRCAKAVTRQWLEEFISTAATVDFSAPVERQRGKLVFTNPAYEKKDGLWKLIYRNGQQPTAVAVAFAREWLDELRPPAPAAPAATAARPAAGKAAPKK